MRNEEGATFVAPSNQHFKLEQPIPCGHPRILAVFGCDLNIDNTEGQIFLGFIELVAFKIQCYSPNRIKTKHPPKPLTNFAGVLPMFPAEGSSL